MLGLKLNHVSKRGYRATTLALGPSRGRPRPREAIIETMIKCGIGTPRSNIPSRWKLLIMTLLLLAFVVWGRQIPSTIHRRSIFWSFISNKKRSSNKEYIATLRVRYLCIWYISSKSLQTWPSSSSGSYTCNVNDWVIHQIICFVWRIFNIVFSDAWANWSPFWRCRFKCFAHDRIFSRNLSDLLCFSPILYSAVQLPHYLWMYPSI